MAGSPRPLLPSARTGRPSTATCNSGCLLSQRRCGSARRARCASRSVRDLGPRTPDHTAIAPARPPHRAGDRQPVPDRSRSTSRNAQVLGLERRRKPSGTQGLLVTLHWAGWERFRLWSTSSPNRPTTPVFPLGRPVRVHVGAAGPASGHVRGGRGAGFLSDVAGVVERGAAVRGAGGRVALPGPGPIRAGGEGVPTLSVDVARRVWRLEGFDGWGTLKAAGPGHDGWPGPRKVRELMPRRSGHSRLCRRRHHLFHAGTLPDKASPLLSPMSEESDSRKVSSSSPRNLVLHFSDSTLCASPLAIRRRTPRNATTGRAIGRSQT